MTAPRFAEPDAPATPLRLVPADGLAALDDRARRWAEAAGFRAKAGEVLRVPDGGGGVASVLVGWGAPADHRRDRFLLARAAGALRAGTYALDHGALDADAAEEAALGWLLAGYRFDRYKGAGDADGPPLLRAPAGVDARRLEAVAAGEWLTRELIDTPANEMGPAELEAAVRALGERHDAVVESVEGDALLEANLPLIHAVGRASTRAPRLVDLRWGERGPQVTLVGKGVCFDTGGLNLKPGASMGLMKKDMGGAATVLGLAHAIMALALPVRLRVLVPAVENAVAGNAVRPGDVLRSRSGRTVEINNTDAEGRLVLADALTLACEAAEAPDLLVTMATLTGAARVAVGPDLAPFYTDDEALAAALGRAGARVRDPVWRMPLHRPYEAMIEPAIADLDNAPAGGMAGSVTAALFLDRFVTRGVRYVHFDIYGWQPRAAPARPKGGVGQGARALLDALPGTLGL